MAKGHLSEDTIKFIMTAESSELQQEVHKATKTLELWFDVGIDR